MPQLSLLDVELLAANSLAANGCDDANTAAVAATVTAAERDGSHSHGLFRLPGYLGSLRSGRVNGAAAPTVTKARPGTLIVDGDGGFAPLALATMTEPLAELARTQGIAMAGVRNIFHFAALWPEVEALAEQGLVALATTAALPYVASPGGTEALFGTNPIAFAWPRAGQVYAFDMATSAMARGDIMLAARDGNDVPIGSGVDADGDDTTDPSAILNGGVQLPIGGHKGAALALMVELMAASLIGERFSFEAEAEYGDDGGPPVGGEFVLAIDPAAAGSSGWANHAEQLFSRIEATEGARLAGARRHANRAHTTMVDVPQSLLDDIESLTT